MASPPVEQKRAKHRRLVNITRRRCPMKTLAELQAAGMPRMTLNDVPIERFGEPESVKANEAALNEYLSQFLPGEQELCPICERRLSITWGFLHGTAHCVDCGYPVRVYHYDLPGCKERVEMALVYHPDELTERKPEE